MLDIPGAFAFSKCRCADSECEHKQETIPELPPKREDRVKGQIYINKKGEKSTWNGRRLRDACCEDGCNKQPNFNDKGQTRPLYCGDHKKDNMIDVKNKRCCEDGCNKQPAFNDKGQTRPLYCGDHKKDNMIDVKNKRCCEDGCNKQPAFNEEGQTTGLYCSVHKKENMIDVLNKRRCCQDGCKKRPYFNEEGQTIGLYCRIHKKDNMIDVLNKRCCEDGCNTVGIPKYEGYCMPCFINNPLNADKPAHRNYKTKEKEIGLAITQRYPDATWILDKRIQDGCSARRPDVLMDLGYHVLMVEVDENQHNNYDCSCEHKRLMELAQDLGHRSMVVIRFNPDGYETLQGERVPSCWKLNKKGVIHIPKEQQKNWDARIKVLLETILYWIDNQSEKQIEIVELFYA